MSSDIPAFVDFFPFNQLVSGSSLLAAQIISENEADVVVNWMGGYHHAKRFKASGFCYTNDIVLGIQHLLRSYDRVLYLDIDVHHGDGVEEAFLTSNRVMTVSFHQFDKEEKFFPGTGDIIDVGQGDGKYYALNIPLKPGCTDESFSQIYSKIMDRVVDVSMKQQPLKTYRPNVIWMQCGADSLQGDMIGGFSLSTKGHGSAVTHMMSYNIPLILVGGGGYTIENVSRCWAYETSLVIGKELPNNLPSNLEFANEYSRDQYVLHYKVSKHKFEEANSREYLESLVQKVFDNLKKIDSAPNIQGVEIPTDYKLRDEEIWNEGTDNKIVDMFIFKDKGVSHLRDDKNS